MREGAREGGSEGGRERAMEGGSERGREKKREERSDRGRDKKVKLSIFTFRIINRIKF